MFRVLLLITDDDFCLRLQGEHGDDGEFGVIGNAGSRGKTGVPGLPGDQGAYGLKVTRNCPKKYVFIYYVRTWALKLIAFFLVWSSSVLPG